MSVRLFYLILLCCFVSVCSAQSTQWMKEKAVADKMWGSKEAGFTDTTVSEKWKGHSSVIIARSLEVEDFNTNGFHEYQFIHYRIKLNDKAAVEEYSEITFNNEQLLGRPVAYILKQELYIGVKVIKPGNAENIVPVSETVTMEIKSGMLKGEYKKLAVPDLEPGDILDYYLARELLLYPLSVGGLALMSPVYISLQTDKPIQNQTIKASTSRDYSFNYKSINGAPEMERTATANGTRIFYKLTDKDREPVKPVRWLYADRVLPTVKFQALFLIQPDEYGLPALAGQPTSSRSSFSESQYKNFLKGGYRDNILLKHLTKYMKKNFGNEQNPEVLAREAYYFVRQFLYVESRDPVTMHKLNFDYSLNDWAFASIFSYYLRKNKIDHDYLITTRNFVTGLEDAVLPSELEVLIRLNSPEPVYIANPGRLTLFGEIPYYYQGNKALSYNRLDNNQDKKLGQVILPTTTSQQNSDQVNIQLSFPEEDQLKTQVRREIIFTGNNRLEEWKFRTLSKEYIEQCQRKKYETKLSKVIVNPSSNSKNLDAQKVHQIYLEERELRKKNISASLEDQMKITVLTIDSIGVLQTGAWHEKRELLYMESFIAEGLITRAGQNLMLNIGKLTDPSTDIKKEELERKFPVYFKHPSSFNHTLTIEIPKGYEVKGLENLNYSNSNPAGGFTSKAELKGNNLVVQTSEYYNNYTLPAEEWPQIVGFLSAAKDFSQQKILLQKNSLTKTSLEFNVQGRK